jgi:DNA-binding transcriptional MocR family regulator
LLRYKVVNVPIRYQIGGHRAADIASSIEAGIRDGELAAGSHLPTVRGLAASLGVSAATVAAAYRELRARGHVSGAGRQGTRILSRGPMAPRGKPVFPPGVRDLAGGNPDPALLPDLRSHLVRLDPVRVLYGVPPSDPELLELSAARFAADGLAPGRLAVVGGALDGIELALSGALRAGDRVAVEDPCYPSVSDLVAALCLVPVPVLLDDQGPTPESLDAALRSGVSACLITPRAQNPFGSALDPGRAAQLRALLRHHPDVLVVEDDHACDITVAPPATLCDARRAAWMQVRSVSKSLGPDLRLAVVSGDSTTVSRIEGRRMLGPGWVSHLLQRLVVSLWRDAATAGIFARAAETYEQRRQALRAELAARGIPSHGRSGFNVWIPVAHEDATVAALLECGWGVLAGERFRISADRAIRVTTACLEPADAARFAADLARALRPVPSRLG